MSSRGRGRRILVANATPERAEMLGQSQPRRIAEDGIEPSSFYGTPRSRIREVYQKLATDEEQQLKLDEGTTFPRLFAAIQIVERKSYAQKF
eukprot:Em0022g999a